MPDSAIAERRQLFVAAMSEAGFPDVQILDDGRTWTHRRINDEDVRLAAFRALFLVQQSKGGKLNHCWPCFRDLPTCTAPTGDAWPTCDHPVVWA